VTTFARPGQAQSKQPQSMGTAYNPSQFARPGQGGMQQGYRGMAQPQGLTMAPPGAPPSQPARPTQLAAPFQFSPLPAPRPSTRDQVRQSAVPNQPRPAAPGMPLGMPGSMQPFWEQAQQSAPGMNRGQQVGIANKMRDTQERQSQAAQQAMQQQSMQQWQAEQAQIGQSLANRTSSPESVAARQQPAPQARPQPPRPHASDLAHVRLGPPRQKVPDVAGQMKKEKEARELEASRQSQQAMNQGFFPQHPLANVLPPFQFQATDFMGNQFNNPGAFTAQQGATAQALNQQRGQQIGNMFAQGTPMGSLNPFAAYQQGQQMVQGGFANPFMR
jgi:hypothetical protein